MASTSSQGNSYEDVAACYIHSLSPIKKAKTSDKQYFDMIIQSEEGHTRAVCLTPDKHETIKSFEEAKSPLKIKNVQKRLWNGNNEYTIQKYSKLQPINQEAVLFTYSDKKTNLEPIKISELASISPEQLVTIKATVAQISTPVTQDTRFGPSLQRQDVVIVDPTDYITLSLWEDHVGRLNPQFTYVFSNVRVKTFRSRIYLNTPKEDNLFNAVVTDDFDENLVEVRYDQDTQIIKVTGNIVGVQKLNKITSCMSCKKQVDVRNEKSFITCGNCLLSFKSDACISSWFAKIIFKPEEARSSLLKLDVFHRVASKICKLIDPECTFDLCNEDDIINTLLKWDMLTISYDKEDLRINDAM